MEGREYKCLNQSKISTTRILNDKFFEQNYF